MIALLDSLVRNYDATRRLSPRVSRKVTECILSAVSARPETRFLEVGAGTGRFGLPLIRRDHDYTGIDLSARMLRRFRHKVEDGFRPPALLQADATALPFASRSFDAVLAMLVIHWIPDWRAALAEIRRVLKPGGAFIYYNGRPRASAEDAQCAGYRFSELELHWEGILRRHGIARAAGPEESEVLQFLEQKGAEISSVVAARWQRSAPVRSYIKRYRTRTFSSVAKVPQSTLVRMISELRQWCRRQYGSLDTPIIRDNQFRLFVVRNWTG